MRRALPSLTIGGWNRLVATLGHVCASQLGHRGQGSDSAGGFPTLAAYLSSWAWSISQMHELHHSKASVTGPRPVAVRLVGSSAPSGVRQRRQEPT